MCWNLSLVRASREEISSNWANRNWNYILSVELIKLWEIRSIIYITVLGSCRWLRCMIATKDSSWWHWFRIYRSICKVFINRFIEISCRDRSSYRLYRNYGRHRLPTMYGNTDHIYTARLVRLSSLATWLLLRLRLTDDCRQVFLFIFLIWFNTAI